MRICFSAALACALMLAGCDAVRFPGDGKPRPERPEPVEQPTNLPEGAPGPPPPAERVEDPYDRGEVPSEPTEASEESDPVEPVTGETETNPETEPAEDETEVSDEETNEETSDTEEEVESSETETPDTEPSESESSETETGETETTETEQETAETESETSEEDTSQEPDTEEGETDSAELVEETTVPGSETSTEDETTETVETPVEEEQDVAEVEPTFTYYQPGSLIGGSGTGSQDRTVYSPDMVFPIKDAPAYAQSMVWRFGGAVVGGDECDPRNYQYPWQDNFCETRSANRGSPFCPLNRIHQGQDLRVGTPEGCLEMRSTTPADRTKYEVVAVEDGIISNVGSYTVNLRAGGRIYRYMHMNMRQLQVSLDQEVKAGDVLGYYSKDFGGSPTTFHLHFEIIQNTPEHGWVHVPPYLSLVAAYERREGGPGKEVEQPVVAAGSRSFPVIPEGLIITD